MHDPSDAALPDLGHGGPEMLRSVLSEQFWFARCTCEIGILHADIGDDFALAYDVRQLAARLRVIVGVAADLAELPQPRGRAEKLWVTEEERS